MLAGCAAAVNYIDPAGPRYSGRHAAAPAAHIRVVSLNLKYGRETAAAAALLTRDGRLRDADIVTLQEMDAPGTDRLARALGLDYVYYPATVHPADGRDFGNAVLARWPLSDDAKLILPGLARFRHQQRIAVSATVAVRGTDIRVYSVHLETPAGLSGDDRRAQLRAVVDDARRWPRVVIAGDFNGRGVVEDVLGGAGLDWLTRDVGRTIALFSWDHVLVRGLRALPGTAAGNVASDGASDHAAVHVDLVPDEGVTH